MQGDAEKCAQSVLQCFHMARIGRPDLLWPVNVLARSVTKLYKACDQSMGRFATRSLPKDHRQCFVLETVSNSVNMDYCKTLHVQDTRKSPSPRLMERCASSGHIRPCLCHGFARIKKQCPTAVPSLRSFRFRLD